MTGKLLAGSLIVAVASIACCPHASAEILFIDGFGDGDAQDGNPATWNVGGQALTTTGVSGGSFGIEIDATGELATSRFVFAEGVSLFDTSIRTQFRFSGSGRAGVQARGLAATITSEGTANFFGRNPMPTGLDPLNEDVVMQLDVIGPTANLWIWRAGDPRPATPFDTASGGRAPGPVALAFQASADSVAAGEFRYAAVATTSIPEPTAGLLLLIGSIGCLWSRYRR